MTPDERKERTRKYNAEYRLKNKEALRIRAAEYHKKNKEKRSANATVWRKNNPAKHWSTRKSYVGTPKGKLSVVKASAKTREIQYALSDDEALSMFNLPCYYCGDIEKVGIDRIDSNRGYETDNCLPCCSMCNYMKRTYSKQEFLNQCKKISGYHT